MCGSPGRRALRATALAFALALSSCTDHGVPAAPTSVVSSAVQDQPTEVDETPFTVEYCGFPVEVVLSGKGKTIDLPAGRTILTSPGLTATLTNLENDVQVTVNITGAFHQTALSNGDVEIVSTGRSALFPPVVAGLVLVVGRWSYVLDADGNLVRPLEGSGERIDICQRLS